MNKEKPSDNLEIEMEAHDTDIKKALIDSEKQFERGDVGTEADILKILRENHK